LARRQRYMLRSMTGFGAGEAENSQGRIYIEIKTLNHKYFDIISRLPAGFLVFEDKIKTRLQKKIKRGRINVFLDYESFAKNHNSANVDMVAARSYVKQLKGLKRSLALSGEVTVQQIITMPGIVAHRPQKVMAAQLWPLAQKALVKALKQLLASKEEEGKALKSHLLKISKKIDTSLVIIKHQAGELEKKYKHKLASSIKTITKSKKIYNREKLEEEVAIFVRNNDISEEICRIDAHIKAFKAAVSNHKEVGRRLDFIAQEISREANTVGAKSSNFRVSKEVIKIKSLVEKIREQTQNVE